MDDITLMRLALAEAEKAAALGEVPVGAVVAKDGEPVAVAHNTRETGKNATHHAELLAIDAAQGPSSTVVSSASCTAHGMQRRAAAAA